MSVLSQNKKPPVPPKPKPRTRLKPSTLRNHSSVPRLGAPHVMLNANGVSSLHTTIEREEAVSFDQVRPFPTVVFTNTLCKKLLPLKSNHFM